MRPRPLSRLGLRFVAFLQRRRRPLALLWLTWAFAMGAQLPRMRVDNSTAVWGLDSPAASLEAQDEGDYLIFGLPTRKGLFDPEDFDHLRKVHEGLQTLDPEAEVLSLWGYFRDSRGWDPGDPITPEDLESLADEVLASPFFEGELIRSDTRVLAAYFEIRDGSTEALKSLKQGIDHLVDESQRAGRPLYWGGVSAVNMVLDEVSTRELIVRFPLGVIAGSVVGLLAGVPVGALLALLSVAALTAFGTLGTLVACGQSMNMLLSILPSMVFFLTLAYGVHVVHAMQAEAGSPARHESLTRTFRPLWDASFSASLGLLAQLTSDFPVLRTMGAYGALGIMSGVFGAYLLLPLVLRRPQDSHVPVERVHRISGSGNRLPFWIGLGLITVAGATQVDTRMDPLDFLPSSHPLRANYRWIEDNLTGLSPFDLVLNFDEPLTDPRELARLDTLLHDLEQIDHVTHVMGATRFFKRFHQNALSEERVLPEHYVMPSDPAEIAEYLHLEGSAGRMLGRFVSDGGRRWRLHLRTTAREAVDFSRLRARVLDSAARAFPAARAETGGILVKIKQMENYLLSSQLKSLFLAWVMVSLILLLRSPTLRIGVLAIPPNTLPILIVFSTMGFAGIPLDLGTVMVTSLAAGLALDDTFHYLASYQGWRERGCENREAIRRGLEQAGPAVLQTASFTAALFVCLATSQFAPVARFGILSFIGVSGGILLDLSLLPELLGRYAEPVRPGSPIR